MYFGMLPTWGDKFNKKWGVGPEVFTVKNAEDFGLFLGDRYKNSPIIWILGGDRNPDSADDMPITEARARTSCKTQLRLYVREFSINSSKTDSRWRALL